MTTQMVNDGELNVPHQQVQEHPLTLHRCFQQSLDRLLEHNVIDGNFRPLSSSLCCFTEISSEALDAMTNANNVPRHRKSYEEAFWRKSNVDIDRVNIVQESAYSMLNQSKCDNKNTSQLLPLQFKQMYLHKNVPCIIQNLSSALPITNQWTHQTHNAARVINESWFLENIGSETSVPIRVSPDELQGSGGDGTKHDDEIIGGDRAVECQTTRLTMKQWISNRHTMNPTKYYLKDWHMQSLFQEKSLYVTPSIFKDVLNPFLLQNEGGDYRFVYWGCKGSLTAVHSDVLNSFSWSFNVIGRKKWTFYQGGDANSDLKTTQILEVIQNQGEMMYVPSGWRHKVENLEETISVNHNWVMICALDRVFECLKSEIVAIEEELTQWGLMNDENMKACELDRTREDMLRGCIGMDVSTFAVLIVECCTDSLLSLKMNVVDNVWETWFDFACSKRILGVLIENINDGDEKGKEVGSINLRRRLISTLGNDLGCQVITLMQVLHTIGNQIMNGIT